MKDIRLFAILLAMLLALAAPACAEPLDRAETEHVVFELVEARYMGSVVTATVRATPKEAGVALAMSAADPGDSSYTEAAEYGEAIWGIDCGAAGDGTGQAWESMGMDRDGAGLLAYVTVALVPGDLPETRTVDVYCSAFAPGDFDKAAERTAVTATVSREAAEAVSVDMDFKVGGFHLTQMDVESTPGGLRTRLTGEAAEGVSPTVAYVSADGVVCGGGNGGGDYDPQSGMYTADHIWTCEGDFPERLDIGFLGKVIAVDVASGEAVVADGDAR